MNGAFTYLPANTSCQVSSPPIAAFIFFTSSGSEVAIFTDTSTGAPSIWSWNFGDGTGSSAQSPVHTYATPGTFMVALSSYDATLPWTTGGRATTANSMPGSFTSWP